MPTPAAARASPAGTATGASSRNARAAPAAARWDQPCSQSLTGASATGRHACSRAAWTASQIPAGSSAQAAARRSRTGGQPRSHAAPYPATVTSVTGHAAIARAASSSQPPALMILRSSHRHTVSLSHDHTLIAAAPG